MSFKSLERLVRRCGTRHLGREMGLLLNGSRGIDGEKVFTLGREWGRVEMTVDLGSEFCARFEHQRISYPWKRATGEWEVVSLTIKHDDVGIWAS